MGLVQLHHAVDATISGTSLVLNGCLLYLILTRPMFAVKALRRIFLLTCLSDLALGTSVFIGSPVIFMSKGYMIVVANGFFANRSELFDRICLAVFCTTLHTNIICVTVQFVYRYRVLCCKKPLGVRAYILFASLGIWCLAHFAMTLWCFVAADTPQALEAAFDYFEQVGFHYDNGTTPFPSATHLSEARTIVHDAMYTVSILGGYSLVIWCQYRMLKFLRYGSDKMTERTRKSHAEVNRALIVLSITPLIGIIGPSALMVALLVLQLQLGPVAVYITLSMTTITVVNPVTIVYFVRPFRKAVSDTIFSKSKTAVLIRTVAIRSLEMDTVTA